MLKNLVVLAVLHLAWALAMPCAMAQTPEGWHVFTSPGRDFKVLMPGSSVAKTEREISGQKEIIYHQKDSDGVSFGVDSGLLINPRDKSIVEPEFVKFVIQEAKRQFPSSQTVEATEEEVNGTGWHGTRVKLSSKDKTLAVFLIAFSNNDDIAYTLFAGSSNKTENVKRFIESFQVDPKLATMTHAGVSRSHNGPWLISIVWTISILILGAAGVSLLSAIFKNKSP